MERRVRVELKSVKIIMVYNLCFHFDSNNLFFYIYLISVLKLVLFLNETYKFYREFNVELHGTDDDHELMAGYNARREESGLAEYDVQCQDFARQFTRHRSKDLMMSSLY